MLETIVIGGGQSGLAVGYYLRRAGVDFAILDRERQPGGAWRHGWESLRLFSPARWSSLPGRIMPGGDTYYPTRDEVVAYLADYETRYDLPVRRPVEVSAVRRDGDALAVETDGGTELARTVVSATGTWSRPYVPRYPGQELFGGEQIHSANYHSPMWLAGQRVLVVGGGNSGAQVMAELSELAETTWVTLDPPHFLPDDVDGRYLFMEETARFLAGREGRDTFHRGPTLGDIVMVEPVREARDRGALVSVRPFTRFTERGVVWPDGREEPFDTVVWCTGFKPALGHLAPLGVLGPDGRVAVRATRSVVEPRLWLVGYGDWTGYASATIVGVGRSARATVDEVAGYLASRSASG
jgi:putative flavoprotein involved in K+ transport